MPEAKGAGTMARPKNVRMVLRKPTPPPDPGPGPDPEPPPDEITNVDELANNAAVVLTDDDGKVVAVHVTAIDETVIVGRKDVLVGHGLGSWNTTVTQDDLDTGRKKLERDVGHEHL